MVTGELFGERLSSVGQMCAAVGGACEVCALFSRVREKEGRDGSRKTLRQSNGFEWIQLVRP